jgi:hypothetical protein
MQEEEALTGGGHTNETLGWIAIEAGAGSAGGLDWIAGRAGSITDDRAVIDLSSQLPGGANAIANLSSYAGGDTAWARGDGGTGGRVGLSVEEEQSTDSETDHTRETVDYLAFNQAGAISGVAESVLPPPPETSFSAVLDSSNGHDVSVYQNDIYPANVTAPTVNVGGWGTVTKTLLRFDLPDVPDGVTGISSATLRLYTIPHETWNRDGRIDISRATEDWIDVPQWSQLPTEADTFRFQNSQEEGYVDIDLTTFAQRWLFEGAVNEGIVMTNVSQNKENNQFVTVDGTDADQLPIFEVDWLLS